METMLFGFFFSHSRSRKIQTPKTKEKKTERFGAGTKPGMNEVNTPV